MKLAYDLYLPPEGTEETSLPPIIFLHGRMDTKNTWRKFAPTITKKTGRKVYAIDERNHGDSPWSDEMTLDALIDDLEEFMKDSNIHRAILVGHSSGSKISMHFALRKPEAVEKLILEDMNTKHYDSVTKEMLLQTFIELKDSIKAVPPNASEVEAKKAVWKFLQAKLLPAQPRETNKGIFDLDTVPIKKEGNTYVWQNNVDVLEKLLVSKKLDMEYSGVYPGDTLFIYGTKSFIKVRDDKDIYKFFPQATKCPIEGAGHLVHQVCPEEFLENIIDFILK